ncbi:MAG TPA: nickel ABC transporter permease [Blastocatellia bacterium]|nr:nickel ABC transporter permease [Blastocatellia bacterium]
MKAILIDLLRRLLLTIPVIFAVVTLVFFLIHLVPGDPVSLLLGPNASVEQYKQLQHELKLDEPLMNQYVDYWRGIFHGDFGRNPITNQSVAERILERYPATIELALAALAVAIIISIPLGVTSAVHHGRWVDSLASVVALLGISLPNFALGPLMILLFSVKFRLLPVSGRGGLNHLILPAITLGAALAAILTRMVRSSVLEELNEDYVRTARAKGLSGNKVLYKHVLKNGLIPVVTILGLQFGILLAGAVITEKIFNWPGLGTLLIDEGINQRDYRLVQGCILMISLTYIFANTLTDMVYRFLDPRIKVS